MSATSACILVVEDSATQAAALTVLLESAGYRTVVARRAERALEVMRDETVQLVLSDVVMPGMDGYELCRRIRAVPEWNGVPVVLLTSLTDPLAIVRGLASGAEHYVTKPYEAHALLARVHAVLSRDHARPVIHSLPFTVELLGTSFTISATKEQILELLVSSYSDLVHTSEAVREGERRASFLAEVTELLSASLDVGQVLHDLAHLMVPRIADVCAVDLLTPQGVPQRTELTSAFAGGAGPSNPSKLAAPVALSAPAVRAIESRAIQLVPAAGRDELAAITTDSQLLGELLAAGPMSLVVIPLVARQRVLALLHCVAPAAGRLGSPQTALLLEDVARRAALALENASLYAEARHATRARDDVLAIVSHDLRNPLNTIQLSATFLLDIAKEGGVPPYEQQLSIIRRSTHRANALIQDLLDVSRIDARSLAVAPVPTSARALLADAVLEMEPLVVGSGLRFAHHWNGPDVEVKADRSRMLQAFSNLVGNALKFTPKDGLITMDGCAGAEGAVFEVADTGSGIAVDHIPHLFDRFWKATQASRSGAGLGLFIVRGIVESHGGRIEVSSEPGHGTVFMFTLPGTTTPEPAS